MHAEIILMPGPIMNKHCHFMNERAKLQHQLAQLAKSPAIQELLADQLRDGKNTPDRRHLALAAMGEATLKEIPGSWIDALSDLLASGDAGLVPDAAP